ncbi:MAG: hypothetical protein KDB27_12860 [Planctomycetales bacterium]|nr:hypothetical protein [Planctomycetales bacterium]
MTIQQFLTATIDEHRPTIRSQGVEVDLDCDHDITAVLTPDVRCAVDLLLFHAIECSTTGGTVSVSVVQTSTDVNIEIADSSDLSVESACAGSIAVARATRQLRIAGCSMKVLNCPQGGVAYSINVPRLARAAA